MSWKSLRLSKSARAHLTPLLISASFGNDSYTIYLTDLTNIWSESLSQKDIVRRSQEENTSIDPSDDKRQLRILLEKIKLGLEGKDGTTSALTINDDENRPGLTLNLTVNLPGGLAPLEWPVRFVAASQTVLTTQFIIPLIGAQHIRLQETASLTKVLREKDHVIQKLLDKLESQGTELGEVFPQAAGKAGRKADRKKAEERVPGVARFDLEAWRNKLTTANLSDVSNLISEVFSGGEEGKVGTLVITAVEGVAEEAWWEEIKGLTVNLDTGKISTKRGRSKSQMAKSPVRQTPTSSVTKNLRKPKSPIPQSKNSDSDDDDEDFQIQSTPPHLKKGAPSSSKNIIDSATESDDDLDAPSQPTKLPDSYPVSQPPAESSPSPPQRKKPSKLGAIGGRKSASKPPVNVHTARDLVGTTKIESMGPGKISPKPRKSIDASDSATEDDIAPVPKPTRHETSDTESDAPFSSPNTRTGKTPVKKVKSSRVPDISSEAESNALSSPKEPNLQEERSPASSPRSKNRFQAKIGGQKPLPEASPSPAPEETSTPVKKKGKLGQIGGKKKITAKADTPEACDGDNIPKKKTVSIIEARQQRPSSSPAPKLSEEHVSVQSKGRPGKEENLQAPEVPETDQERADKKRAALKRELEEKAKASAPVKKKRKF